MERPRVWMQEILLAPELSATSRIVRIWIMVHSSAGCRRPATGRLLLVRALQNFVDRPALVSRQRAALLDQDPVADLALALLIVRHETRTAPQVFVVQRMHHQTLHLDDHRLLHLVAD